MLFGNPSITEIVKSGLVLVLMLDEDLCRYHFSSYVDSSASRQGQAQHPRVPRESQCLLVEPWRLLHPRWRFDHLCVER